MEKSSERTLWSLPYLFILCRLLLIISLPYEGLQGYGDYVHFYRLAGLGQPFLEYWVEFPPIFPFLSQFIYQLAAGQEHVYVYLLALLLSIAQMGNLALFMRLEGLVRPERQAARGWVYFSILSVTAYGWWYFDPLVVFAMLLTLVWVMEGRDLPAGLVLAVGILLKWFPALLLPAIWRSVPIKKALRVTVIAIGAVALVWSGLYFRSAAFTEASLVSQAKKGSWETVWALLDGNLSTGNFGPESERIEPGTAWQSRGNPARISSVITLGFFGFLGGLFFIKARSLAKSRMVSFVGLTLALFFLWSPGWSPQWVLYLVPLILLTMPLRDGVLLGITLLLINLLEWPVFLSRGLVWGLWLTIPIRTLMLIGLSIFWGKMVLESVELTSEGTIHGISPGRQVNNP